LARRDSGAVRGCARPLRAVPRERRRATANGIMRAPSFLVVPPAVPTGTLPRRDLDCPRLVRRCQGEPIRAHLRATHGPGAAPSSAATPGARRLLASRRTPHFTWRADTLPAARCSRAQGSAPEGWSQDSGRMRYAPARTEGRASSARRPRRSMPVRRVREGHQAFPHARPARSGSAA
jgi:hypothetical protein